MSYEQFWDGDPNLVVAYRRADDIRKHRKNEELWLQGVYFCEAITATVGNMFSKQAKFKYPSEPSCITESELRDKKERERKAREERIKSAFIARALQINSRMRSDRNDTD